MKHSIHKNKESHLLKEFISEFITKLLSEQQQPPAAPPMDPNAVPPPMDPTMAGADPNAAAGMPPMDPAAAAGGMPADPNAPPMPGAEGGEMPPVEGEEGAEGEEGGEDTDKKPEDLSQGVVDKVKEEMETDQNKGPTDLVKIAKGYLQDFGLLDDKKKYQALAVVEKLREEEVPELDKVADYLEKFLLGQ